MIGPKRECPPEFNENAWYFMSDPFTIPLNV